MSTKQVHLLLVILLALPPVMARAQAPEEEAATTSPATDEERAREHFQKGSHEYRLANWEASLEQFSQALRLRPRASVLLNMGQCHRQLGNVRKALFYYRSYLEQWQRENPGSPARPPFEPEVKGHITALEPSLKPEETTKQPPASPPAKKVKAPQAAVAPEPPDRTKLIAGWSLVGGGLALEAAGIALAVLAANKADELEQASALKTADFSAYKDLEDEGKALEAGQIATMVVGGAALAAGAVLLILHYGQESAETRAWLSPALLPGGGGLTAGLRF